jgi:signal transduction histidine kinase
MEQQGIGVEFTDDEQPKPLKQDVAVLCYRVVQELLTNVVKHAHARNVRVSVARDGDQVRLTVADDGIGFTPEEISPNGEGARGFGLSSVTERLHHLDGDLKVESTPGQGTRVTVTVPLP